MSAAIEESKEEEQRSSDLHELLFGVRRSIRYHNRRRRFFDGFDKFSNILSVIGGSAAVAAVIGSAHWAAIALATMVAVVSAISLVVASAQAARLHTHLAKQFATLEHDIVRSKRPDADKLNEFVARRLLIEAEEPPALRVLDTLCHNELCEALGYERCHFYKVGWFQSLFAHLLDLWPSKIREEK